MATWLNSLWWHTWTPRRRVLTLPQWMGPARMTTAGLTLVELRLAWDATILLAARIAADAGQTAHQQGDGTPADEGRSASALARRLADAAMT